MTEFRANLHIVTLITTCPQASICWNNCSFPPPWVSYCSPIDLKKVITCPRSSGQLSKWVYDVTAEGFCVAGLFSSSPTTHKATCCIVSAFLLHTNSRPESLLYWLPHSLGSWLYAYCLFVICAHRGTVRLHKKCGGLETQIDVVVAEFIQTTKKHHFLILSAFNFAE